MYHCSQDKDCGIRLGQYFCNKYVKGQWSELFYCEDEDKIKNALPDGFIQGRSICTNLKVIRHIILQRHDHKLPQWRYFCEKMKELKYYEYLGLNV